MPATSDTVKWVLLAAVIAVAVVIRLAFKHSIRRLEREDEALRRGSGPDTGVILSAPVLGPLGYHQLACIHPPPLPPPTDTDVLAPIRTAAARRLATAGGELMPARAAADADLVARHEAEAARLAWLFKHWQEQERHAWADMKNRFDYDMTWERLVERG